jgi:hypothetical protein
LKFSKFIATPFQDHVSVTQIFTCKQHDYPLKFLLLNLHRDVFMTAATPDTYLVHTGGGQLQVRYYDTQKNRELLAQSERMYSNLKAHHWAVIIPTLILICSTVSLIICASNDCLSSSRSEPRIKGCDILCPEAQKIASIVGLVVGAIGSSISCYFYCKKNKQEEDSD